MRKLKLEVKQLVQDSGAGQWQSRPCKLSYLRLAYVIVEIHRNFSGMLVIFCVFPLIFPYLLLHGQSSKGKYKRWLGFCCGGGLFVF